MLSDLLMICSDQPGLSLAIWLVVLIALLYLARRPAHLMIKTIGWAVYCFMRTAARAVTPVERHVIKRKEQLVLAQGREATEKNIQREFTRASEDKAARALTASSLTQFFIAGLVLFVAVMGGLINFEQTLKQSSLSADRHFGHLFR